MLQTAAGVMFVSVAWSCAGVSLETVPLVYALTHRFPALSKVASCRLVKFDAENTAVGTLGSELASNWSALYFAMCRALNVANSDPCASNSRDTTHRAQVSAGAPSSTGGVVVTLPV